MTGQPVRHAFSIVQRPGFTFSVVVSACDGLLPVLRGAASHVQRCISVTCPGPNMGDGRERYR